MHTSSTNWSQKINSETPIVKESFDHQPSICNLEFEYLTILNWRRCNQKEKLMLYLKVFIVLFINGKVNISYQEQ